MKFTQENLSSFCEVDSHTGCWLWKGANNGRYGIATITQQKRYMHRLSYELFIGPIPKGQCVCHKCDTPRCINPEHLFLGSLSDNRMDCLGKKRWKSRQPRSEHNHNAKLSISKAREIRSIYANGQISQHALAKRYGVSQTAIRLVLLGETYKEII